MLKMKAEAVRMRSSRALKRLRNMLEKEGITL
jgi:DNA-directed RNA polymerase specialized sigma24 family protein